MNTPKDGGPAFPSEWNPIGLSKRELMATLIMAGFAANQRWATSVVRETAQIAVNAADELLKALVENP